MFNFSIDAAHSLFLNYELFDTHAWSIIFRPAAYMTILLCNKS